jgi:hypothetical protein
MELIRLRFSPEFPPGAGFSREQSHHSWPSEEKPDFAEQIAPAWL